MAGPEVNFAPQVRVDIISQPRSLNLAGTAKWGSVDTTTELWIIGVGIT